MTGEVLQRGEHAVGAEPLELARTLQPLDRGDAHFGDEVRVLAESFLDPSPARIAGDVDHRREHVERAARTHLAGNQRLHPAHEIAVERARQRDRLREHRGVARHVAVERFLMDQQRDTEAGALHRPLLQRVDELDRLPRRAPAVRGAAGGLADAGHAALVRRAPERADAVGEVGTGLGSIEGEPVEHPVLAGPDAAQLGNFLRQRHPRQQIGDPRRDRRLGILVERWPIPGERQRRLRHRQGRGAAAGEELQSCAAGYHIFSPPACGMGRGRVSRSVVVVPSPSPSRKREGNKVCGPGPFTASPSASCP